jgi:hypothetical protein
MRGRDVTLSADDLLLGGGETHAIAVPAAILHPAGGGEDGTVVLRPLRLVELQRIHKASQDQEALTSVLMVQQALVEPKLSIDQVSRMHAGLVQFLLREVNRISGLELGSDEIETLVRTPLARACFVLAREFGWTPDECANLTMGQIMLYVSMLGRARAEVAPA